MSVSFVNFVSLVVDDFALREEAICFSGYQLKFGSSSGWAF
jgi:hypothetical protein